MAYIRSIPQPGDLISVSQGQILGNFQAIDSGTTQNGFGFSRNHVTMTDATNGGLHNRIDFYQNISAPTPSGYVGALYPANISSASELQYTNAGGSTQITSGSLPIWKGGSTSTGIITATNSGNGALNLPNGIQFRWGSATVNTSGTPVTYSSAFSNSTYSVQLTPQSTVERGAAVNSLSSTGFTAYSENNGNVMYYFAVGH
jgi:hypothetical protein